MENNFIPKLEKIATTKEFVEKKVPHIFEIFGNEKIEENGKITIENDFIKSQFNYEDLNLNIVNIPRTEEEFIGSNLNSNERALIRFLGFHPEQYCLLKNFYIENKQNSFTLNLDKELGENVIYVKKGGNNLSGSASHYLNTFIKLNIEPKSAAGILTMLHEIGHKKDPKVDPLEIMLVSLGKEKDENILKKEMIDRERYAWAYSLSKLKPFLDGLNIKSGDIDLLVHKFALGSYSASINPEILKR